MDKKEKDQEPELNCLGISDHLTNEEIIDIATDRLAWILWQHYLYLLAKKRGKEPPLLFRQPNPNQSP